MDGVPDFDDAFEHLFRDIERAELEYSSLVNEAFDAFTAELDAAEEFALIPDVDPFADDDELLPDEFGNMDEVSDASELRGPFPSYGDATVYQESVPLHSRIIHDAYTDAWYVYVGYDAR
jgi:hypothetical protein